MSLSMQIVTMIPCCTHLKSLDEERIKKKCVLDLKLLINVITVEAWGQRALPGPRKEHFLSRLGSTPVLLVSTLVIILWNPSLAAMTASVAA